MSDTDPSVANSRPFYMAGGTLPGDAPSYVTRQADYDLLAGLRAGQFCYVLTSRQMGKSSLMVRIASQLRAEDVAVVILDLTALGQNLSVEQWYYGLLEQLGRYLGLEDELDDYWQAHKGLGPMQRWMTAIRDVALCNASRQIVIFVDEIDIVRSLPFSSDEFFAAIRECYNRRAQEPQYQRLTFCLLGVATPSDLIRDARLTPFNIGRRIELTDFSHEEAAPLAVGISVTGREGRALLDRILYWTGGHPYLTQRLCASVAADSAALREEDVDRLCAGLFMAHGARMSDDNLQFVRNRLLRSEVDQMALLILYSRVRQGARVADDETNVLTSLLKLAGIVRVERGQLKVRNRIYERVFNRDWVQTHLPNAELRRQRIAYRQGLLRATALSGTALVAISGLALYGFSQAQRANHNAALARQAAVQAQTLADTVEHTSYIARMNLVQRDWEARDLTDVSELLADTRNSRFRGFEWGYWRRRLHLDRLTLRGHTSGVSSVAYSPDGKRIVTGSWDGTAKMWDAVTGRDLLTLKGQTSGVVSVAFCLDGTRIVTGGADGTVKVWNAATGQLTLTLEAHATWVLAVAFSPDGKQIVTGGDDDTAQLWDASTGRERFALKGHSGWILSAAFSPDGKRILTGSADKTARVWNAATGRQLLALKGHSDIVTSAAFSPDGRRIVTGSHDTTTRIWDAATGRTTLALKGHAGGVTSVRFSPNGAQIVTGSWDTTARIWDASTGKETLSLQGHTNVVNAVAFSPDGKQIVTGCASGTAKIWDTTDRATLNLKTDQAGVSSVAFSPDGSRIVTGSQDGAAKVWDAATGNESFTLRGHLDLVTSVAFSPDGKRILTGSQDGTAKVWDASTGREVLTLNGQIGGIFSVAFSPDGKRIVTGIMDGTAKVWDAATGEERFTLQGHTEVVTSTAFSPDGKHIVTGSQDKTARVWDADTGRQMLTLKGHTYNVSSVAFSPDGSRIVTGSWDNTSKVWDAATGRAILTLRGHTDNVTSVAYSPDGKRIVTGSQDKTARVWDAATGQEALTLIGHTDTVTSVAFSPDGKRIVTGSQDKTVRIWSSDEAPIPGSTSH
jgi:WD40 repeat protein